MGIKTLFTLVILGRDEGSGRGGMRRRQLDPIERGLTRHIRDLKKRFLEIEYEIIPMEHIDSKCREFNCLSLDIRISRIIACNATISQQ